VSQLIYGFYVVGGKPERPSPLFGWSSILLPSFVFGLFVGAVVWLLSRAQPLRGWAVFFGCLILSLVVLSFATGSASMVVATLVSPGDALFFVALTLVPLWAFFTTGRANPTLQGTRDEAARP